MSNDSMNTGDMNQFQRPTHVTDYALACLQALSARGLGEQFSLGGHLGLLPIAITLSGEVDPLVP